MFLLGGLLFIVFELDKWEFISVDWGRYVSTVVFDVQFLSIKKYVSLNSINNNLNVHEHIDF